MPQTLNWSAKKISKWNKMTKKYLWYDLLIIAMTGDIGKEGKFGILEISVHPWCIFFNRYIASNLLKATKSIWIQGKYISHISGTWWFVRVRSGSVAYAGRVRERTIRSRIWCVALVIFQTSLQNYVSYSKKMPLQALTLKLAIVPEKKS